MAERVVETRAELSFIGDHVVYLSHNQAARSGPRMTALLTRDTHREAINLFEHALALDPQSIEAKSRLAGVLVTGVFAGMAGPPAADLARAETLVNQVLAASPRYEFAHHVKGHVLLALKGWEEAIPEYEAALALNHNLVAALHGLAWCKLYAGSIEEVTPFVEQAIRVSPRDPGIGHCYDLIGTVHPLQSHIDEAVVWLEKARSAMPGVPIFRSHLAAAYALSGKTERASAELAEHAFYALKMLFRASRRSRPAHQGRCRRRPAPCTKPLT